MGKKTVLLTCLTGLWCCACSINHDQWTPWYAWRGTTQLALEIQVDTVPRDAAVYLDGIYQGQTPLRVTLGHHCAVRGERQELPGNHIDSRHTEFVQKTPFALVLRKKGYRDKERTFILEEFFPADQISHNGKYHQDISWRVALRKRSRLLPGSHTPPPKPPVSPPPQTKEL